MALFGFAKKEEAKKGCCCNETCSPEEMQAAESTKIDTGIKVLGGGCAKCHGLEANVRAALQELEVKENVELITDYAVIASYGIMTTPALVIDGKVVSYGKVLSKEEARELIKSVRGQRGMNHQAFEVKQSEDYDVIKEIFTEYSQIKGAESCFISFDKELADLASFYKGGAILVGYESSLPAGCIAIKNIDGKACEAKRLYIRPEFRGKGYARLLLNAMLDKSRELGFEEVRFTTKPEVMKTAYELYKRMGFEELGQEEGTASMRMVLEQIERKD